MNNLKYPKLKFNPNQADKQHLHRWAQLMQKLAPLTAVPLIENISYANANPITQIFRQRKLTQIRYSAN